MTSARAPCFGHATGHGGLSNPGQSREDSGLVFVEQAVNGRCVRVPAKRRPRRTLVANPAPSCDGLLIWGFQRIEDTTPLFGQVVNASAPSSTADDVGASNGHQTVVDQMAQRHVERRANEAKAFRHTRQTQLPGHVPRITQTVGKWAQPAEDPGLRLGQHTSR